MPRKLRVHYSNAIYHVMMQGNFKQNIFVDNTDYLFFQDLLAKVTKQYGCKIHLYCLMTNHVHMVIQVNQIPLSKIMLSITPTYAKRINNKLNRRGHLFRDRYLCKIADSRRYLAELCYYIHNNPIKAGMVMQLDDYQWSSHHCYTKTRNQEWVTTDHIEDILLELVGGTNIYKNYINARCSGERPEFCNLDENGNLVIPEKKTQKQPVERLLDLRGMSILQISEVVQAYFGISSTSLKSDSKNQLFVQARVLLVYFAHFCGRYRLIDIAYFLERPPDSLSKTLHSQFSNDKKSIHFEKYVKQLSFKFQDMILKNG